MNEPVYTHYIHIQSYTYLYTVYIYTVSALTAVNLQFQSHSHQCAPQDKEDPDQQQHLLQMLRKRGPCEDRGIRQHGDGSKPIPSLFTN